jgi:hypothetical protein
MDVQLNIETASYKSSSVRTSVSQATMPPAENANRPVSSTANPCTRTGTAAGHGYQQNSRVPLGDLTNVPPTVAKTEEDKQPARYTFQEQDVAMYGARSMRPANRSPEPPFPLAEALPTSSLQLRQEPETTLFDIFNEQDRDNDNLMDDPQLEDDYVAEFIDSLFDDESLSRVDISYMNAQRELNAVLRGMMVDWLVKVHSTFRLRSATLHLAIQLLDRFLAKTQVPRRLFELVAIVTLFIASKFEDVSRKNLSEPQKDLLRAIGVRRPMEVQPLQTADIFYVTSNRYRQDDIYTIERTILATLGFQLTFPTAAHFSEILQKANDCDSTHAHLSNYFIELSLTDLRMVRYAPSLLVSASLLLSNHLLERPERWPVHMVQQSRYEERTLMPCAEEIALLVDAAPSALLQAVRKKYSLPQYHEVSRMSFLQAQ